jgi:hypothetical protein
VSASQVDEHGNAQEVAESTTSFEIDTIDPSVASGDDKVDADAEVVVDADTGGMVTISATFDEAMDQGVLPEFILAPDVASTLTAQDTGSWEGDTFSITYDVSDADFDADSVSVDVIGAQDVAGNPMTDYTPSVEFGVDTQNPVAPVLTVTDSDATLGDAAGGAFTVTAEDGAEISLTLTGSNFTQATQDLADAQAQLSGAQGDKSAADQALVEAQGVADAVATAASEAQGVADAAADAVNETQGVADAAMIAASEAQGAADADKEEN